MLSNKKKFIVIIGDKGAVIALNDSNKIKNKIFLEELTEESKIDLKNLFIKNQLVPISILLDTVDQSYKKKTYPTIKKRDLEHIVKRDMANEGDSESLKNYLIFDNKKKDGSGVKSESLFVLASKTEKISNWLDFLLDMPNHTTGIYMLPIESFHLFQLLKKDIKIISKAKRSSGDSIYFLIIQTKVSGMRQIIFSDQGIIFTRSVNYEVQEKDFLEKYEQDIYSTFEYLKRLLPEIRILEIDIINILSADFLEKIKTIHSTELNFINYTPSEAATKTGYDKILSENSKYCDLLISKAVSSSKKILKFTTPQINSLGKLFNALKISYWVNFIIALISFISAVAVVFIPSSTSKMVAQAKIERSIANRELEKANLLNDDQGPKITENNVVIENDQIVDIGKVNETISAIGTDFVKTYYDLSFLKKNDVKLLSFLYSISSSFNGKNIATKTKYSLSFKGNIDNKSGDINDIFKDFDSLSGEIKKKFADKKIEYPAIPRNIDFVQKYYTFPVEFTISQQ
ncbi:MAG: hypothetical protein SFV53_00320 [Rickettsiales bacterium]|nr:hypothetical protein [Rickettsiales bacterium]